MRWTHARTPLLMIVLLTLPLSVCVSSRELMPPGEQIIEYGTPGQSLSCPQPSVAARPDTQVVGVNGGRLRSGNVQLRIPRRALQNERRFVLQDSGLVVGARVDVEERIEFQDSSAFLTFDVSSCDREQIERQDWWVWRWNPIDGQSQKLRTVINPNRAMTVIDSTSVFLIAN